MEAACGVSLAAVYGGWVRKCLPGVGKADRVVVVVCGGSNVSLEMLVSVGILVPHFSFISFCMLITYLGSANRKRIRRHMPVILAPPVCRNQQQQLQQ